MTDLSCEFPLSPLLFPSLNLLGRYGLSGAGLGVSIMSWPPWSLLGVVMLPPLGPPVLEPNLENKIEYENKHFCLIYNFTKVLEKSVDRLNQSL